MSGTTASYSHACQTWGQKLREAVALYDQAFKVIYRSAYE